MIKYISGGANLLLVTQEWAFVGDRRLLKYYEPGVN